MSSRSIHVVACVSASLFIQLNNIPLYVVRVYHFIHLSVDGYLSCIYMLTIVINAALKMCMQVSL